MHNLHRLIVGQTAFYCRSSLRSDGPISKSPTHKNNERPSSSPGPDGREGENKTKKIGPIYYIIPLDVEYIYSQRGGSQIFISHRTCVCVLCVPEKRKQTPVRVGGLPAGGARELRKMNVLSLLVRARLFYKAAFLFKYILK